MAWEVFQAPVLLMALEQAASASWIKWPLFVLASLTSARKLVLASRTDWGQIVQASRVACEQMALAVAIDAAS